MVHKRIEQTGERQSAVRRITGLVHQTAAKLVIGQPPARRLP